MELPLFFLTMRERKSGHVINVSSIAGHGGWAANSVISPGAVSTELAETITDPELKAAFDELYKGAIDAENIACAIAFAIQQPSDVAINEMIIRPTHQEA